MPTTVLLKKFSWDLLPRSDPLFQVLHLQLDGYFPGMKQKKEIISLESEKHLEKLAAGMGLKLYCRNLFALIQTPDLFIESFIKQGLPYSYYSREEYNKVRSGFSDPFPGALKNRNRPDCLLLLFAVLAKGSLPQSVTSCSEISAREWPHDVRAGVRTAESTESVQQSA
jgi:hypothetical protein